MQLLSLLYEYGRIKVDNKFINVKRNRLTNNITYAKKASDKKTQKILEKLINDNIQSYTLDNK